MSRDLLNKLKDSLGIVPVMVSMIVVSDFRPAVLARGFNWLKRDFGWEYSPLKACGFRSWENNHIDEALYCLERM